jgi:hypothetical protein
MEQDCGDRVKSLARRGLSDLPILSQSTLQSLTPQKDEALADAKQRIRSHPV